MNGCYVYLLLDPLNFYLPFYIGKGQGKRWQGHLRETLETARNKLKVQRIVSIRDAGHQPAVIFWAEGMSEEAAYDLEESLIRRFGRIGYEEDGLLTNRVFSKRGHGIKGTKHRRPRTAEHVRKLVESRAGWSPSEQTRRLWSQQRRGRKFTPAQKLKRSKIFSGSGNPNSCEWYVTDPSGTRHVVNGDLAAWCRERGFRFKQVYCSTGGFSTIRVGRGKGGGRKRSLVA